MTITIPPFEKTRSGDQTCDYACPFNDDSAWGCGLNAADPIRMDIQIPGPSCPGPGTYRLEKEKS